MLSTTLYTAVLTVFAAGAAAQGHGSGEEDKMGPVGFLWPEDRAWHADHDNTAPCGSVAGVTVRTEFPLSGGAVALTIGDDAWDVSIALSTSSNPTKQSDFGTPTHTISTLDGGHQCYKLPDFGANVKEGDVATIQLQYSSTEEDGKKDTFYACADVQFVAARTFTKSIPCFNVTSDEFELEGDGPSASTGSGNSGSSSGSGNSNSGSSNSQPVSVVEDDDDESAAGMVKVASWAVTAVGAVMFGMLLN